MLSVAILAAFIIALGLLGGHPNADLVNLKNIGWARGALSPDSQSFRCVDANNVDLWDVKTHSVILRFEGHTDSVKSVAFSPDGHFVLSGSLDETVRLWDKNTGQEVRRFNGHTNTNMAL
jgi:WD40 repeat protein